MFKKTYEGITKGLTKMASDLKLLAEKNDAEIVANRTKIADLEQRRIKGMVERNRCLSTAGKIEELLD